MKHTDALIDKLSRSSQRQHRGLMALLVLASLLVGTSYWAIQRVLEEQQKTVRFHFSRLMENISEQKAFISKLTQLSQEGKMLSDEIAKLHIFEPLPDEGSHIFQGQEHAFSIPFSIKIDPHKVRGDQYVKAFALGANLATFYSTFWSTSNYQSPQVFLINDQDNFDIAVPSSEHSRVKTLQHDEAVVDVVTRILHHSKTPSPGALIWTRFETTTDTMRPPRFLAYTHLDLPASEIHIKGAQPRVIIATLLSLTQVDDYERTLDGAQYDHFTLLAPSGELLNGSALPDPSLAEGVNFTSEGLQIKVSHSEGTGWTAVYTISFAHFFRYAMWPLVVVAVSLLGMICLGWATNRWYRRRVILPAQQAHARIAESEAFSRIVIDTAPTGLCVVRRSDNQVLMENQRAQHWQGSIQLAMALEHHPETEIMGEAYLEIEGRHLQVGFVSTRYKGQDARLYAFNDITQHIEDASALKEARRAADAANEAKTLFLATMSHEIRTPLYGVLGTLELLGMTRLEPRQQEYLQTIQRSSATLFQLISDVLDVSKIESGQMGIDLVEFCPLDLVEDTMHTYSAFAQRKGLQLYACTDATLPDRLLGDPMRIRQILNNLLSNAIKFTDSGHVVLRTRVLDMQAGAASLEFQVTDSGIGISVAQQEKLFELFYQVQDACTEGGAGLGLPICWWLSEMMNGQLRVTSEPGLGSSFALRIQLTVVPGRLPDCESIIPGGAQVYVRAPVQELSQTVIDWLNRFGLPATQVTPLLEKLPEQRVLVDLLPTSSASLWPGPRIVCAPAGGAGSDPLNQTWDVDLFDLRAIAQAVSFAQQGKPLPPRHVSAQCAENLDLHILTVEDNPINQAILKDQLEALGCTTLVVSNGEQAIDHWRPGMFDLVLTDINMPVMSGYELARVLRKLDPDLPIIGVTANAMREEGVRCIAVGMNAWVVKPLSIQTLRSHLIKLCRPLLKTSAHRIETEALTAPMPDASQDHVQLTPAMRELFIRTMQQDMLLVSMALEHGDGAQLAQILHRIAGGLAAVQASDLAQCCSDLETRLTDAALDSALGARVQDVLLQLSTLIGSLE